MCCERAHEKWSKKCCVSICPFFELAFTVFSDISVYLYRNVRLPPPYKKCFCAMVGQYIVSDPTSPGSACNPDRHWLHNYSGAQTRPMLHGRADVPTLSSDASVLQVTYSICRTKPELSESQPLNKRSISSFDMSGFPAVNITVGEKQQSHVTMRSAHAQQNVRNGIQSHILLWTHTECAPAFVFSAN